MENITSQFEKLRFPQIIQDTGCWCFGVCNICASLLHVRVSNLMYVSTQLGLVEISLGLYTLFL